MDEDAAMSYEPQTFSAPDGTPMVVLPAAEYARLKLLAEDAEDVASAKAIEARIAAGEGTMPSEVLDMMLDEGITPLAAWRRYRGLSQAALARRAALSQAWVGRIEGRGGYGSRETRRRLAAALEAPLWAIEYEERLESASRPASPGKGRKFWPLRDHLKESGKAVIVMNFRKVAALVGGLPPSAANYRPWWANHHGNSQARGWMDAGYEAKPDLARRFVTFKRIG
jgi:transcriptional regulator with XRE-family HTH domain